MFFSEKNPMHSTVLNASFQTVNYIKPNHYICSERKNFSKVTYYSYIHYGYHAYIQ